MTIEHFNQKRHETRAGPHKDYSSPGRPFASGLTRNYKKTLQNLILSLMLLGLHLPTSEHSF